MLPVISEQLGGRCKQLALGPCTFFAPPPQLVDDVYLRKGGSPADCVHECLPRLHKLEKLVIEFSSYEDPVGFDEGDGGDKGDLEGSGGPTILYDLVMDDPLLEELVGANVASRRPSLRSVVLRLPHDGAEP